MRAGRAQSAARLRPTRRRGRRGGAADCGGAAAVCGVDAAICAARRRSLRRRAAGVAESAPQFAPRAPQIAAAPPQTARKLRRRRRKLRRAEAQIAVSRIAIAVSRIAIAAAFLQRYRKERKRKEEEEEEKRRKRGFVNHHRDYIPLRAISCHRARARHSRDRMQNCMKIGSESQNFPPATGGASRPARPSKDQDARRARSSRARGRDNCARAIDQRARRIRGGGARNYECGMAAGRRRRLDGGAVGGAATGDGGADGGASGDAAARRPATSRRWRRDRLDGRRGDGRAAARRETQQRSSSAAAWRRRAAAAYSWAARR